jgi:hypothetical protein
MKVANLTMGKPKRPGKKSPYSLQPAIDAFLALPLGKGFAALPDLIDADSVEKSTLHLRQPFTMKPSVLSLKPTGIYTFTLGSNSLPTRSSISSVLNMKWRPNMKSVSSVTFVYIKKPMKS